MSKYRKHIWANETMPYYKQYLNEMEAQIDKLSKGGGGGSQKLYIATYIISAINTETDHECHFAVNHFQTDGNLAEDVSGVIDTITENGNRFDILVSGYIAGEDIEGADTNPYPLSSIHTAHITDDGKLAIQFWSSYLGDLNSITFDSYELKASNIKEIAAGGGSGEGGLQKYEIYLGWDNDAEEYFFEHDGERLAFEDVYEAIINENYFVYLYDEYYVYTLNTYSEDDHVTFSCTEPYTVEIDEDNIASMCYTQGVTMFNDNYIEYTECNLLSYDGIVTHEMNYDTNPTLIPNVGAVCDFVDARTTENITDDTDGNLIPNVNAVRNYSGGGSGEVTPIRINLYNGNGSITGSLLTFVFGYDVDGEYDFWQYLRNNGYSPETDACSEFKVFNGNISVIDGMDQWKNINRISWIQAGFYDEGMHRPTLLIQYLELDSYNTFITKTMSCYFSITRDYYTPGYEPEFLDNVCLVYVNFADDRDPSRAHHVAIYDGTDDSGTYMSGAQGNSSPIPVLAPRCIPESGHIYIKVENEDGYYIGDPIVTGGVKKTGNFSVVDVNGSGTVTFNISFNEA